MPAKNARSEMVAWLLLAVATSALVAALVSHARLQDALHEQKHATEATEQQLQEALAKACIGEAQVSAQPVPMAHTHGGGWAHGH